MLDEAAHAIRAMLVRGAPLIGATAAYGVALAMRRDASDAALGQACRVLLATRPTAVNLRWALEDMAAVLKGVAPGERADAALRARRRDLRRGCRDQPRHRHAWLAAAARRLRQEGAGRAGQRADALQRRLARHRRLGHGAGADLHAAHEAGIPVHVWVDETRPRNQGASLTAWELGQHGVPHTVIVDNAGGHLMQHGRVDLCIVGTDRTTAAGDVSNKIGTYLKALAAADNGVPFYVALPSPTIDWTISDGRREIPIEERDRRRGHARSPGACPTAPGDACGSRPMAAPPPTTPST